ncbi:MAG: amino acid ABC transporter permease [Candidatus Thalassarchaeum sp.]|nr:amino acid ABC transporter permease [Candidatus Thalassarchaeum sp.]
MTGEDNTRVSPFKEFTNSFSDRLTNFSLVEFEESVAGKSGAKFLDENSNKIVSYATIGLAVIIGLFGLEMQQHWLLEMLTSDGLLAMQASTTDAVLTDGRVVSFSESFLYSTISALALIMAWWVTLTVLIKQTFRKSVSTALLGISTAWIIFIVTRGLSHFFLIEADWVVVWANRDLVMMGQLMKEQMTQSPGSAMCIDTNDCYGINQNFRLWWTTYLTCGLFGAAYGTSNKNPLKFVVGFGILAGIITLIATNPTEVSYNTDVVTTKILICVAITYATFAASFYYSSNSEEYIVNRLRSYLTIYAISIFFFALIIMDPPQFVKKLAELAGGNPAQSFSDEIIAGTAVPSTMDKLAGNGIEASQWGGLFVNLIVATAGCVLGFGIGVVLAFGRQSELPLFKVPSVMLIELVRSGPLICWLYFAVFMMPDLMDPFYDAEDIIRMLLMFGIFGGCYIAEVLRGGLQAVDSGQKEAAMALGLSPIQTKMTVELPNAVRTTLPSIVSVFIGLWKDTTLLFIVNILDFFKLAKDLPNTDLRFLGDFLEPLYVTAIVFWVFAFYLSRLSMGIEKNLGLVKEGGGEMA